MQEEITIPNKLRSDKEKGKRLIKAAQLRETTASLSNVDFDPVRKLKKSEVARLSDCQWVKNGNNLIITGATGVGKTYLMSAYGREACLHGYSVKCFRVTRLLTDLSIGKGDGSYNKLMRYWIALYETPIALA